MQEKGFQVLAISPDRPEKLAEGAAKNKINYTLLSDSKSEAARAFGLAFKVDEKLFKTYKGFGIDIEADSGETHRELPVPAVYIFDKNGTVKFQYVNPDYRARLNADILKAAIEVFGK